MLDMERSGMQFEVSVAIITAAARVDDSVTLLLDLQAWASFCPKRVRLPIGKSHFRRVFLLLFV